MQANLQAKTFNKHNLPKNDRINKLANPRMNKISRDLSFKRRSITNTERNPEHINGGDEYLYTKRIKLIRRQLQNHLITPEQYNALLKEIQIARFGRPLEPTEQVVKPFARRAQTHSAISETPEQPKPNTPKANEQPVDEPDEEEDDIDEEEEEAPQEEQKQPDNRPLLEIINNPDNKPQ